MNKGDEFRMYLEGSISYPYASIVAFSRENNCDFEELISVNAIEALKYFRSQENERKRSCSL